MFRRLFCCANDALTPCRDVKGESNRRAPKRGEKETKSTKDGFSLKRLFGCLWKKDKAPSKSKREVKSSSNTKPSGSFWLSRKRNRIFPAEYIEPERKAKVESRKVPVPQAQSSHQDLKPVPPKMTFDLSHFGLINVGNTCYLNASIQSIMNIAPFMDRVSSQENIWKHSKEAGVLRHLQDILDLRKPPGKHWIRQILLLRSFKKIIASKAPEFCGVQQKDAHEFLTVLIEQIQSVAPMLQMSAFSLGTKYRCPVDLIRFSMDWTRTCRRCMMSSSRRQFNTNISLNLRPHSTVDHLLQDYFKETELEYICSCGGPVSSLKSSLKSLPTVLILHLKRFTFTHQYALQKLSHDVHLNQDLVVSSERDAGCFSLMGVISHIGPSADSGHYIFDGRSPADNPCEQMDRWLTYDDYFVHETTGRAVCRKRQSTAYILFYQRVM